MRLLSATVRNYRIHEDVTVPFSETLTLVGGRNESGKSTLAEAIHRGLFLRATIGGKTRDAMQSDLHSGHPEVELRFLSSGSEWEIHKVFGRASGKATLREKGGATLHGDEAEAKLAELMQVEEPAGGQRGARQSLEQWSHLWVWQGSGGDDPTDHAAPHRDALLKRLEEEGGGAVMQSDQDSRVANHFREELDLFFTKGGQTKAGSDLQRAESEKEDATRELEEASGAMTRLEEAMRLFEESEAVLASEDAIEQFEKDQAEARKRSRLVTELRHRLDLEERARDEAERQRDQFLEAVAERDRLAGEVARLEAGVEPGEEKRKAAETALAAAREAVDRAGRASEAADAALAEARDRRELSDAWGRLLRHREDLAKWEEQRAEVEALEKKKQDVGSRLAALPPVDEARFRELQQHEAERSEARAVLEAMSTGIELVRSDREVRTDGDALVEGEERILERNSRVTIGEETEIVIRPGGGTDLESARSRFHEAEEKRQEAFRDAGIASLEEAGTARAQREALESDQREIFTLLGQRKGDDLSGEIDRLRQEIAAGEGEVERRSTGSGDFEPPGSISEARTIFDRLRKEASDREEQVTTARQRLEAAREGARVAEEQRDAAKQASEEGQQTLIEQRALLEAKTAPLGSEKERAAKAKEQSEAVTAAEARCLALQKEMEALEPDSIEADLDRLKRAIAQKKEEVGRARENRAVARNMLASDGTSDPAARLASARARAEAAEERHGSLRRRAEAIRLLHERFAEEQQRLSDRFARPLAEKVSGYLRLILGPSASATLSFVDGAIEGWGLSRAHGAYAFDKLSGGTREQIAAAVRLAVAEILARDHGDCLPIVFDDAFTNTDPDRIRSLHRMLDLAARNGLQVIVLTCNPGDYAGLGAQAVTLEGATG